MTKDKLSKYLFNLKELACKACSGEEEKCFSCGMKLGTILRILDYHFSISEQERKEAREAISKHVPKTGLGYFVGGNIVYSLNDKVVNTILKVLGGEK